mmetsp:Transcript_126556/g.219271  ORF Transcript_126556/g.219271 Transcript_126556/m.219271 type:complete len:448 (-) Transcript_126556:556-1899(-)
MVCAILVFFMQTGFTMLECGTCRSKNSINIVFKNTLDACMSGMAFCAIGWAIAYGGDTHGGPRNGFIGSGEFFLVSSGAFGGYAGWFFQWAFAATTATIVSGAVAERCAVGGYMVMSFIMISFIYPVVVHWVWSGAGWLSAFCDTDAFNRVGTNGLIDFAGSGVVHLTGGVAAFVGAAILGPRKDRFGPKDESPEDQAARDKAFAPHNHTLVAMGTLILWLGWYGFNAGSTLALSGGFHAVSAKVCVTTTMAAAAGGWAALILARIFKKFWDADSMMNGVLAGLVGITAGCSTLEPWAAALSGFIAGIIYYGWCALLRKIKVDDVLGASAVHGAAGIWGVIAVGLFATPGNMAAAYADTGVHGLFYGGGGEQLGVQVLGCVAIIAWVAVTSGIMFGVMKVAGILRVSEAEEVMGLDEAEHGGSGYAFDKPSTQVFTHKKVHPEPVNV